MTELLDLAVKAHGGLERWNKIKAIKVAASITGAIWYVKGKPDALKNVVLTAETRDERLTVDFPGQNKQARFEPNRIVIESANGGLIDARDDPEKSFEGQQRETPWDDIDVVYFVGEALWTYLNTPFLYTYEGFITEEVPSIQVENETWRRLKVTFPDSVKSHTKEQISCFGPDGLLRRHDYTVDILGGATGLNYAMEYRDVDGIIVPTKRRVYAYEGDYQLVKEPLLVAIDMGDITLAYAEHPTLPEVKRFTLHPSSPRRHRDSEPDHHGASYQNAGRDQPRAYPLECGVLRTACLRWSDHLGGNGDQRRCSWLSCCSGNLYERTDCRLAPRNERGSSTWWSNRDADWPPWKKLALVAPAGWVPACCTLCDSPDYSSAYPRLPASCSGATSRIGNR